jgi:benzoyl-CoA reductase subunit C
MGEPMKAIETFPAWRDQSLDEALLACRELVEDATFPTVKKWREAGGKVVGHFQVYFPEELAHAAGMLPVKIRGATIDAQAAESRFGSYLCSIVKTSLELALSGHIELDLFVSHPICDAARNLAAIWGRNCGHECQILYLPQNANSKSTVSYLRREYGRMLATIEKVAGGQVTPADLARSVEVFNENRALMRDLYAIKRDTPWLIDIEDAYVLVALAGFLPREEHNEILRSLLPRIRERSRRSQDRVRVVFEGGFCEQPPLDLLAAIGRSCYVVDDDLMIGLRWILEDVAPGDDPLHALAEAYIETSSYSPVQHDLRKPKERMLVDRIHGSKAAAAIVTAAKMCEPGLEEQVTYTQALEEAGVPHFVSEFQDTMTSFSQIEMQLETFVENLLFSETEA